jgi:hypothetical protein
MAKFKSIERDGFRWLVYETAEGHRVWLYRQCRVGDRYRPGQRMREPV